MKTYYVVIITSLFLAMSTKASSQYILKKWNGFSYEGIKINKRNLGMILDPSPQSMLYYREYESKNRKGRLELWQGSGLTLSSLGLIYLLSKRETNQVGEVVIGSIALSLYIGGIIKGMQGALNLYKSWKYRDAAVNHFNWEVQEKLKKEKQTLSLNFTYNGYGLVYSF